MQSPIALQLASAVVETLSLNRLPHFCCWPIQYALANLITFPEGQLLRQSFSHFLAHIDLFEYTLDRDMLLSFTRNEPSIFMLFTFNGFISLFKTPEELIAESPGGAFHMGYVDKGSYKVNVKAGSSKLLLLTLRAEWVMRKAETYLHFKPLIAKFTAARRPNYYLPDCPINREVLKQVQKMLLYDGPKTELLEINITQALTQLSHLYQEMISDSKYSYQEFNRIKANEIKTYIQDGIKKRCNMVKWQ